MSSFVRLAPDGAPVALATPELVLDPAFAALDEASRCPEKVLDRMMRSSGEGIGCRFPCRRCFRPAGPHVRCHAVCRLVFAGTAAMTAGTPASHLY
jgi:hypothetical protein